MCKFIKNIILKFKKKSMKELTKDEVYYALWHLIREDEQTTSLDVKKFLREQNFFATQAQVSKFMQEILNDSNDLKAYSNGTHLIYQYNFDEDNDGYKHALDDGTIELQEDFNNKFNDQKYILKTVLISDVFEQSPNNWVVFDKNKNVYHIYPEHYTRDNVRCYFSKTENIKIQDTRSRRVQNIK